MNRIVALATSSVAIAIAFASQVQVNFDRSADFLHYKTYCLVQTAAQSASPAFPAGFWNRIPGLIEERLAEGRIKPVSSDGDLMVSYSVHITEHPQKINLSDGVGPTGLGYGNTVYMATLRTIYEWTLVINIVDAKRNHIVFEGTLSQTTGSTPERNAKKLIRAFHEILASYPPRPY